MNRLNFSGYACLLAIAGAERAGSTGTAGSYAGGYEGRFPWDVGFSKRKLMRREGGGELTTKREWGVGFSRCKTMRPHEGLGGIKD